jgi:carbamate kinase
MKTFAILANYSKFKRVVVKEALQIIPKNQASLLNFIKLCINATEIDSASYNLINFSELQKMVENSLNPKVSQMFKYLKEIKNKEVKIGSLSESATKMFNM